MVKMKKSKNPFYRLLGIKSSRPHHYKLLGVPRSADVKQIELAAQARLEQLKAGDPDQDAAQLEKVVAAIEKARSVLGDPDRRKAYDLKLDAAASSKSNHQTSNRREPSVARQTYSQDDLLPPQLPGSSVESSEADEQETDKTPAVAQPIDVADPSNIPLAVPLSSPTEPKDKRPSDLEPGGRAGGDYDPVSGLKHKRPFSGKFKVRPKGKRGGKRSMMLPLVSMFFFVVGVAGLLFFLFKYMEMNGETQLAGGATTTVVPTDKDQGADPGKGDDNHSPAVKRPSVVTPENKPENKPENEPENKPKTSRKTSRKMSRRIPLRVTVGLTMGKPILSSQTLNQRGPTPPRMRRWIRNPPIPTRPMMTVPRINQPVFCRLVIKLSFGG